MTLTFGTTKKEILPAGTGQEDDSYFRHRTEDDSYVDTHTSDNTSDDTLPDSPPWICEPSPYTQQTTPQTTPCPTATWICEPSPYTTPCPTATWICEPSPYTLVRRHLSRGHPSRPPRQSANLHPYTHQTTPPTTPCPTAPQNESTQSANPHLYT